MSIIGSFPNFLAVLSAVDGFPSVGEPGLGRNRFSWNLFIPVVQTVHAPIDVTSSYRVLGRSNGFFARNAPSFYSVYKVLSCPSRALLEDDTVEGLDCFSLTLGKACKVTCADRHTAVGNIEITMTCDFDLEPTSILLAFFFSCKWGSCDLSALVEVAPDNETFRFGPFKKSSHAVIFLSAVGPLVDQHESG